MRKIVAYGLILAPIAAAVALFGISTPARAADAVAGRELVGRWCASCHATGATATAVDSAPPFTTIANDPARTETRLKSWLTSPHPPMPNFSLTRVEIDDILAYFETLKTR